MLVDEFRNQINKGTGKALMILQDDKNNKKYLKAILHACTHNTSYDPQCEGDRSQYLWEAIQYSSYSDFLQDQVLQLLMQSTKQYDIEQMIRLARLFAANGNEQARIVMREALRYDKEWNRFIGAEEIILLEGIEGLTYVADTIGSKIISDPEYWEDDWLLDVAKKHLGDTKVSDCLAEVCKINPRVAAYCKSVETLIRRRGAYVGRKIESYSYSEMRDLMDNPQKFSPSFSYWGKHASDGDILKAAEALLGERNSGKLVKYLKIFWQRPFPLDQGKIAAMAYSKNRQLAEAAIWALRNIKHDSNHALALDLLQKTPRNYDAIELLVQNYQEQDYHLLEDIVLEKHNKYRFHDISYPILEIFKKHDTLNCMSIMVQIYKSNWCSTCRERCIDIMIKNRVIPDWIVSECQYDCNLHIRQKIIDYNSEINTTPNQ